MKKTKKTVKKDNASLIDIRQWLVVALLVIVLLTFGLMVYGADNVWGSL
ncbi:MAG: hypothetical protein WAS27_01875 [Candidatus Saccharimonadales bacterium]